MNLYLGLFLVSATLVLATEPEVRPSGLKIEFLSKPDSCEKAAENGQLLTMHYTGTLEDGTKFDSSLDRNEPFKFQIGVGQVIRGWDEGVLGMCVGEKRNLIVPPELGYGDQGAGDVIPGGATLNFEIELIDTEVGPQPVNVFSQIDENKDNNLSREELSGYLKSQVDSMRDAGGEQAEEADKMENDQDKLVEEIFSHEDKDKDGYISHEEFSGPKHDEL
jgi:FK506-binding protein 14